MPGLTFEAEAGLIESPFTVASGTVSQSVEVSTPSSGGRARYRVTIPSTGNYRVNMNVNAPNIAANSLFIDFDQEPTTPTTIWDVQALTSGIETRSVSWRGTGAFDAPQFNPKVWNLSAGEHTLCIRGREAGMQVDAITIVPTVPLMPGLTFEAEAGLIESPFTVASGTVSQSVEVSTPSSGGRARYRVTIPSTGNYRVNMNVNAPNIAANSLFIDFDQEPTTPTTIWDVQALTSGIETRSVSWRGTGAFGAPQFNPKVWNLSAGEHTLCIRGREAGMQVDAITIVPTVPLMPGLTFEAEAGLIESPFTVASGTVSQSVEVSTPSSGGRARYRVTIPSTGNYRVNMNVNAPNIAANSLFIDFDQEPTTPTTIWDVQALTSGIETRSVSWRGTGAFDAPQFNPKVWNLSAGEHTLCIRGREAGMQVDAITIVPQPSSQHPTAPNNVRIISIQ